MFTSTLSSTHVGEEGEIHIIFAKFACVQFKIKVSFHTAVNFLNGNVYSTLVSFF